MKLKIFNFDTVIDVSNNIISVVEIEDIRLFRKVIETLQFQVKNQEGEEKIWIYDDEFDEINFQKVDIISNYMDIFSNLKLFNQIFKVIDSNLDEEKEDAIRKINLYLNEFATDLLYDIDIDLDFKETFNLKELLKIIKVRITDDGSIVDNLFTLINFYSYIKIERILFFINLKSYLNREEVLEFYRHVLANNIKVILLEGRASDKLLENEQKMHIDSTFDDHYRLYSSDI